MLPALGGLQGFDPERSRFSCGRDVAASGRLTWNPGASRYERDAPAAGRHCRPERRADLWRCADDTSTGSPMDHSEPILASLEALPDMLTARDLEAVMQIDRKTIYAYVQRG